MTHDTWILIADAARARLCVQTGLAGPCRTVQSFAHPSALGPDRDLGSDRPGRVQQPGGTGARAALQPRSTPKRLAAAQFAREIMAATADALRQDAHGRLLLVAPPRFLGLLREAVRAPLRDRIEASVAADLTAVPEHELPERLAALRADA
jgi:protein required for attachment to host cells